VVVVASVRLQIVVVVVPIVAVEDIVHTEEVHHHIAQVEEDIAAVVAGVEGTALAVAAVVGVEGRNRDIAAAAAAEVVADREDPR